MGYEGASLVTLFEATGLKKRWPRAVSRHGYNPTFQKPPKGDKAGTTGMRTQNQWVMLFSGYFSITPCGPVGWIKRNGSTKRPGSMDPLRLIYPTFFSAWTP